MVLKLLAESPIVEGIDFLIEERDKNKPSIMYITGPYIVAEEVNKNNRLYPLDETVNEVARFNKEIILNNRALGELEHPANASINAERACHMITELRQDGNVFIGKSRVLSSPMGLIVRSLVLDGVKLGMSSRALGKLTEDRGHNRVSGMRLVTVDCVADPSAPGAFVNGILESKEYVLSEDGKLEEYYDTFERAISSLPRKEVDQYLRNKIVDFIRSIKK
jgi:hypothetical protein